MSYYLLIISILLGSSWIQTQGFLKSHKVFNPEFWDCPENDEVNDEDEEPQTRPPYYWAITIGVIVICIGFLVIVFKCLYDRWKEAFKKFQKNNFSINPLKWFSPSQNSNGDIFASNSRDIVEGFYPNYIFEPNYKDNRDISLTAEQLDSRSEHNRLLHDETQFNANEETIGASQCIISPPESPVDVKLINPLDPLAKGRYGKVWKSNEVEGKTYAIKVFLGDETVIQDF